MRSVVLPGLWGKRLGVPLVPWEQQPVQPFHERQRLQIGGHEFGICRAGRAALGLG